MSKYYFRLTTEKIKNFCKKELINYIIQCLNEQVSYIDKKYYKENDSLTKDIYFILEDKNEKI